MLPKQYRLPATSFSHTPFSGRRHHTPLFTLINSSTNLGHLRLAVIISKKVSPLATARNRLKRLLHQAVQETLGTTPSIDLLIIAKPTPPPPTLTNLKQALTSLHLQPIPHPL